ncbi:hypothetical protein LOTGIDRAFT_232674 [Lottia gigantea]|uniref:Uncharacterized protein n=1 Tax=Lottia gigantea TaxID=225164 RepID=V3ZP86_LOTGI|nr:hypothetical protein LOTGIDRAFT_232674 [Lottia gigantea]ESO93213.1 hypothetical protein LOTGIDRAFT_232674 [Lottia gigantea]
MATLGRSNISIWSVPYIKLTARNSSEHDVETDYNETALNDRDTIVSRRPSKRRGTIPTFEDNISISFSYIRRGKMSKSGLRHEPLIEEDRDYDKDVSPCIGISIGVCAAIAGLGGIGAIVILKALELYRTDISYLYMSCYPFVFPVITGVAMAYKRKMGSLTLHFGVLIFGMIGGSVFYAFSIFPVYMDKDKCTDVLMEGDCQKTALVYLYVAFGGVGVVFSLFGFLCTLCACCKASKTIASRIEHEETRQQMKQQSELEAKKQMKAAGMKSNYTPTTNNGTAKQNGGYENLAANLDDKLMTKL